MFLGEFRCFTLFYEENWVGGLGVWLLLVGFGKGPRGAWEEGGQLVFLGTFVGWGFVSGYGGLKLYNLWS
jgi:hypothetical protein